MVEAALAFPLLLGTLLCLVQFALVMHTRFVLTGAVQDGARVAAAVDGSVGRGVEHSQEIIRAGLGRSANAFTVTGAGNGSWVRIEARGNYRMIIPWGNGGNLQFTVQAFSQKERFHVGP